MTIPAIVLVLMSTFMHAGWNLLSKRQNPSGAFFLIASLAAGLCLLPLVFLYDRALPLIPASVWVLLVVTGLCQTVYYVGLAGAYRHGDMSVAYPLARALPAILVACTSLLLGLGKPPSGWGLVGIGAVGGGCLILPLVRFRDIKLANYWNPCCALALLAACGTSGYTLVDNEALHQLRAMSISGLNSIQITWLFMALETYTTTIALSVYVMLTPVERQAFRAILQTGKHQAMITGVMITGTYGLVLMAMGYVTNISYLAAFRELSIPLGAVLGMIFQKETAHPPKLIGIGVVLVGLLLIGLA